MSEGAVAVFGLSGVGKSTLAQQFCLLYPSVLYVGASAILKQRIGDKRHASNAVQLRQNQNIIASTLKEIRLSETGRRLLFEGHSMIDAGEWLFKVPFSTIAALNPGLIIYIADDVNTLMKRRLNDKQRRRLNRSANELKEQERLAKETAHSYAHRLGCSFQELPQVAFKQFETAILETFPDWR